MHTQCDDCKFLFLATVPLNTRTPYFLVNASYWGLTLSFREVGVEIGLTTFASFGMHGWYTIQLQKASSNNLVQAVLLTDVEPTNANTPLIVAGCIVAVASVLWGVLRR
jgi:hypothetical protein